MRLSGNLFLSLRDENTPRAGGQFLSRSAPRVSELGGNQTVGSSQFSAIEISNTCSETWCSEMQAVLQQLKSSWKLGDLRATFKVSFLPLGFILYMRISKGHF